MLFKPRADCHALMKIFYFLNYLKQFKQTNKIEPGHFFYKNKVLCIQYETSLKLQASITFSHLDIYTWYSIYTQMKYCKYKFAKLFLSTGMCPFYSCENAFTNGLESYEGQEKSSKSNTNMI